MTSIPSTGAAAILTFRTYSLIGSTVHSADWNISTALYIGAVVAGISVSLPTILTITSSISAVRISTLHTVADMLGTETADAHGTMAGLSPARTIAECVQDLTASADITRMARTAGLMSLPAVATPTVM